MNMMKLSNEKKIAPVRPRTFKELYPEDAQAPKWGRSVNRQAQAMIFSVFLFIRDELNRGVPLYPFDTIWTKLAAMVGLCTDTVQKYVSMGLTGSPFITPGKKRTRPKPMVDIDCSIKKQIRELIYNYAASRRSITVAILLELIRENNIAYAGGRDSLRKLIIEMGFKFKTRDGRRFLLDRKDIAQKRIQFLINYKQAKDDKKPIIFLDETWIFRNGISKTKEWQNRNRRSCSVKTNKTDARYIILHAGGKDGFIPGASLIHCTTQKPKQFDDYHGDMDGEMFQRWFQEQLLPNLNESSVIVLDNASYHSVQYEKQPTNSWLKADIQQWLKDRDIHSHLKITKKQLLDLCAPIKEVEIKNFLLDKYVNENTDHKVLRLPPYYCCYNTIELAWANAKQYYDRHVGYDNKYSDERTKKLWQEALDRITPEIWGKMCKKTDRKITRHYNRYILGLTMEEGKDPLKGLFEEPTESPASSIASSGDADETTSIEEDSIKQIMQDNKINEVESNDDANTTSRKVRRKIDYESLMQIDDTNNQQISSRIPCIRLVEVSDSGDNNSSQLLVRNMDIDDMNREKMSFTQITEASDSKLQSDMYIQLPIPVDQTLCKLPDKKVDADEPQNDSLAFPLDWLQKPETTEIGFISRIKLTVADLCTLKQEKWLNDTVINIYMQLIMKIDEDSIYAMNSNFIQKLLNVTSSGIDRWTKNVDIFSKKLILIPYHTNGNHWALFVLNIVNKTTTYYDSLSYSLSPGLFAVIEQYLEEEFMRKRGRALTGWINETAQDIPQQKNFVDCGVYMCMYAHYICKDTPFKFTDKNVPEYREQMIQEILQQRLQALPFSAQKKIQQRTAYDNVFLFQSATYSQASVAFPEDRRNAQCMAIATYALAALIIHDNQPITQSVMDNFIKKGDAYYVACRKHFNVAQTHLAIDELISPLMIGNRLVSIDIRLLPFQGPFDKNAYKKMLSVIQKCVEQYRSNFNEWGFLFIGHAKAVGFKINTISGGFLNKPEFLLFNSHRVDRDNKEIKTAKRNTGAARLFKCRSGESLSKMLLIDHAMNESIWHIYPMKITSTLAGNGS